MEWVFLDPFRKERGFRKESVKKNRLKLLRKKREKKNRGISKEKQVIETIVGDGLKNL